MLESITSYFSTATEVQKINLPNGGILIYCPPDEQPTFLVENYSDDTIEEDLLELAEYLEKDEEAAKQPVEERSKKPLSFIGPDGQIVVATSISEFCRNHFGLAKNGRPRLVSSFSEQRSGVRRKATVEGWTLLSK